MKNSISKYIILSISILIISEIANEILGVKKLIYNSLAEKLTSSQIEYDFKIPQSKRKLRKLVIKPYKMAKGKSIFRRKFMWRIYDYL